MKFFPHLVLGILILILVFLQASSAAGSSTVSAGFEVKDSGGNVLPDTLVIVQGITNTGFSESKLTDSAGKASFALNKDEFFIYIIYKLSYKEQTAGFFTIGDRNFSITLEKLPEDQWYFYRVNNGEMEFQFSSPDDDTNYQTGEYIKTVLETRNVGEKNIKLVQDKAVFQIIDGQTLNNLRAWGDFVGSGSSDLGEITLKKDGWIKATLSEEM